MHEFAPVSRNKVKNEPSRRQSILCKFDTDTVWCLDTAIPTPAYHDTLPFVLLSKTLPVIAQDFSDRTLQGPFYLPVIIVLVYVRGSKRPHLDYVKYLVVLHDTNMGTNCTL